MKINIFLQNFVVFGYFIGKQKGGTHTVDMRRLWGNSRGMWHDRNITVDIKCEVFN